MIKLGLLCASTATVALFADAAHAQNTAPADPAATPAAQPQPGGEVLEEITITALKRATDLQRTPAVVDVVQSASLERAGIANIAAIDNIAPALNFGQINGLYTTVAIRGVTSLDATELGDPAVA